MGSHKKQNFQAKQYCEQFKRQVKSFLSDKFFQARRLVGTIGNKIRRWPRIWQVSFFYLLVLFLTGSIYLWRTAQLRTINPYVEKINFEELAEQDPPENSPAVKKPDGPDGPDEPVTAPSGDTDKVSAKAVTGPSLFWPVEGRSVALDYGGSTMEALSSLNKAVKWTYSKGLGIVAISGERVHSIGEGRVKGVNEAGKPYGKEIVIEHKNNLTVYYGALEQVKVKKGDIVKGGQIIATVKESPEGETTYLYLEALENGRAIDPLKILPQF